MKISKRRQALFDKIATHLRTMKKQSKSEDPGDDGICMYRAPDGNMCAIGCAISDRNYRPEMEETDIATLLASEHFSHLLKGLAPHVVMLKGLQEAHDANRNWLPGNKGMQKRKLEHALREIAGYSDVVYTRAA